MSCACSRLFSTGSLQGHTVSFLLHRPARTGSIRVRVAGAIRCARNRLSAWRQPGIVGHAPADTQNRDGAKLVIEGHPPVVANPEISKISLQRTRRWREVDS